ncbi:phage portal protein [Rhodopseudomonas sp. BR0C11]|uniref:phage portal protein n=1 Tax=Rhodopseudomonas sp. BR0C11 TaxID=2269370 RepID=UPI0013DFDD21|nr:phage portal protein [Rhodopseudomonas sp. BR0C11]
MTADLALKASAVFACIKVLAETMGSLPLQVYRKLPDGSLEPANDHPVGDLIRYQPNKIQTAVEFWETTILHAALRGTGYAEIVSGPRGAVDQLRSLHADRVVQELLPDGTLRFRVTDPFTGRTRVLLQEEVFRIPGLSSDGVNGLRAVDLAADAIGLGMSADEYASRVFSNSLNIGGFLSAQKRMSVQAQRRLISKLMELYAGGNNSGRPMLLQDGIKFEKASMDASEAQLLEARKWQIAEVARFWRIPLHMLGIDDQTNRSTVEEQSINFVKYTIRPWARRIEQAIRRDLITATNLYEAKFNLDALERGNLTARAEYFSKALGAGGAPAWLTQNEVRLIEGWNRRPEPWADVLPQGSMAQRSDNTQPPSDPPANSALVEPEPPKAIEDQRIDGGALRVAQKENKAVRKALMRLAAKPDEFREWVAAFYGGHVSFVMETLGFDRTKARRYCAFQRDELIAANDIEAVVDRREQELAKVLSAAVKVQGVADGRNAAVQA